MLEGPSELGMAYDEALAARLRDILRPEAGVTEMKMFGGLAYLINGNMAVAASGGGGLMLRCEPAETEALLAKPGAARFEMRGKSMDGWLRVESSAVESDEALERWARIGVAFARSRPPK